MKRVRTLTALILLSCVATLAEAKVDRVLHEPIPEDLYKQGTQQERGNPGRTNAGAAPTGGGQAGAPAAARTPESAKTPGGAAHDDADSFTIDRDTRRPNVLPYSDPFQPSVAPFKRLHAYDAIADSYTMTEGGEPRHEVTEAPADPNDIVFKAKLTLPIESGVAVRLPTPGPGAHLLSAEGSIGGKIVSFIVRSDSADNWDLEAATSGNLELTLRVAVSPDAFGGDFGDPKWDDLPGVMPLSAHAMTSAAQVTHAIGVSRALPVRETMRRLVAYFRSFQDSNEPPPASGDVYLDLALSKKGVCRHRAFAFFVTARSLGIPTRLLTNEAHAWVEVHNGTRWKRVDLGGAGGALEAGVQAPMTPPPDPFAWPDSADRGSDLASRSATPSGVTSGGGAGGAGGASNGAGTGPGTITQGDGPPGPKALPSTTTLPEAPQNQGPAANVEVLATEPNTKRGGMLPVRGKVSADGRACPHASVIISLREQHGHAPSVMLGTVPAKEDGSFESSVFVPRDLPPGDYQVLAQSQGDSRCAKSAAP